MQPTHDLDIIIPSAYYHPLIENIKNQPGFEFKKQFKLLSTFCRNQLLTKFTYKNKIDLDIREDSSTSLLKESESRDFTINSLYFNIPDKKLIDPSKNNVIKIFINLFLSYF